MSENKAGMCQNLQRLRSSEENLFHICFSKKLRLWLLNTLHRNLWTHLWYSCGFDYHTCHTLRPSQCREESQADSLAGQELWRDSRRPAFTALPSASLLSLLASHPNRFCSTMHHCLICIISLFIFAVRVLLPTGSRVSHRGAGVRLRAVLTVPVAGPWGSLPHAPAVGGPWAAEELWTGLKFSSHFVCSEKGGSFP